MSTHYTTPNTLFRFPQVLTMGLALLAPGVQAQSGCAVEQDDVDPFTKERVVCIVADGVSSGPAYRWHAVDQKKTLRLTWTAPGSTPMVVLEGDTLYLLLETDTVVELYSVSTEVGDYKVDDQGLSHYTGTYTFAVPESVLSLLQHNWVTRLRMHHTRGYLDYAAAQVPTWQYGFTNTLGCLLSTCSVQPMPANAVLGQKIVPVKAVVY